MFHVIRFWFILGPHSSLFSRICHPPVEGGKGAVFVSPFGETDIAAPSEIGGKGTAFS